MSFNVYRYLHASCDLFFNHRICTNPEPRGDLEARKTEQENAELRSTLAQLQANPPRAPLQLGEHGLMGNVGCQGIIPWIVGMVDVMWGYFTNLYVELLDLLRTS